MASMLEIMAEAKSAATRQWDRARAAFSNRDTSPDALARVIEGDIIPRLMAAHNLGAGRAAAAVPAGFAAEFARAALAEDVGPLQARLEALLAGGVSVETVLLDVLAPAARQLGALWDEDDCDFVDVTMALWRCQELVHGVSALMPGSTPTGPDRTALFAPVPGEQHALGAVIVEECFRRAGWQSHSTPALQEDELLALVAARGFDLIGLTLSAERHLPALPQVIERVRRAARRRDAIVLVGGWPFAQRPELAREVGADGTAVDGAAAVRLAEQLLENRGTKAISPP